MTEPLLYEMSNCSTELDNLENNHSFQNMIKRCLTEKNVNVFIMILVPRIQNQTSKKYFREVGFNQPPQRGLQAITQSLPLPPD